VPRSEPGTAGSNCSNLRCLLLSQVFAGFTDDELDRLVTYLDRIDANVRPLLGP
jgi:hypothetical protein